jgi:hypothetical protein
MSEDGRLACKDSFRLQLVFEFAQVAAIEPTHQFRFQQALDGVSGHVHRTAPPGRVLERPRVVHPMFSCLGLFTHSVKQIAHHLALPQGAGNVSHAGTSSTWQRVTHSSHSSIHLTSFFLCHILQQVSHSQSQHFLPRRMFRKLHFGRQKSSQRQQYEG